MLNHVQDRLRGSGWQDAGNAGFTSVAPHSHCVQGRVASGDMPRRNDMLAAREGHQVK